MIELKASAAALSRADPIRPMDWVTPRVHPLSEAVTNRIIQIARQYERAVREVVARHGISLGDAEVVLTLAHSEQPHPTPGELAKAFQITAGSMTTRLTRLERAGYIERRINRTTG
jgi:DNA-binding MarR family transcriptional regulator